MPLVVLADTSLQMSRTCHRIKEIATKEIEALFSQNRPKQAKMPGQAMLVLECQFLGPRGPLVLPLIGPARPSALKIWITYIQAYTGLMNHEKTHQTDPMSMVPGDPLDAVLTRLDPPVTPKSTPSDP